MRRAVALPVLLSALTVAAGTALPATVAVAAPAGSVTVEGTYQHVVADGRDGRSHAERDLLVAGDKTYRLTLPKGHTLEPGSKVRVKGRLTTTADGPQALTADQTTVTASTSDAPAATTQHRVLVILASWTGPDTLTPDAARHQVFTDADGWYREVSYGALGLTGDVTPWLSIAGPDNGLCFTNHRQTMTQAKEAAKALGYDAASYDRTVLYHPRSSNPDCSGYAGWAYQPGTEVWLNGVMDRRTSVHELGHNLGLRHAHAYTCQDTTGTLVAYVSPGCTSNEYGDQFDAMGASFYVGHFSAAQKAQLGWGSARHADLSAGGSADLAPLSSTTGTVAAKVVEGTRTYWVERRVASGADAALPAGGTAGVLVRVTDTSVGKGHGLLDHSPDGDHGSAVLGFGRAWQLPGGRWLSVGEATAAGVTVTVGDAPLDSTAPGEVTALAGKVRKRVLGLAWTNPADTDLAAVRVYLSTSGGDARAVGSLVHEGVGTSASLPAPGRGETWTVLVSTVDAHGNESAGVAGTATSRGLTLS
ncbi:MAG TPA: hypothetical protein VNU26_16435 [Mycobacteriales bacterium]|nr:hypothetical protein [Mycobacteriales bacterium]